MSGAIIVFRWEATVMDNMKKILKKMPKVMKKSFKKSNTHDVLLEQANRMVINDNNLYLNN